MAEYIERESVIKAIASVKMSDVVPNWNEPAIKEAVCKQGQAIKKIIKDEPAADVVEVETYNDLREAFVDFVCSGVHNPAPYCKNRRSTCVDKRGWCTYNDWCNGFNPDGRKG
jgi:hypothetical protein